MRGRNQWTAIARAALLTTLLVGATNALRAQVPLGENRRQATRADLEKSAQAAEQAAAATTDTRLKAQLLADASAKRQRLKNGDFTPGDRILIQVYGDSVLSDTFTVRNDRMLQLPDLPAVSLQGVLDSELESFLTKSLLVYIKEVHVSATPLVQLGVLGAVGHPGFMTVPVDMRITDVIMDAGGPAGSQSDLDRAVVTRDGQTVIDQRGFQDAIRLGKTVGDISIRDGDQIFVPDRTSRMSLSKVGAALGAIGGFYWLLRWGRRR